MKYIRRMMSFLAFRAVIFTVAAAALVCAFYIAFNLGNAYVLISEGMEKRVDVALTRENATDLNNYFTGSFLNDDPVLEYAFSDVSPYLPYTITSYDYKVTVESISVWPWGNEIQCEIVEHVDNITGNVKAAYASSVSGKPAVWSSGRYFLRLTKQSNGQWKISAIHQDPTYKDTSTGK
ncbi:MAG: hypothetical protein IJC48_04850 [Clostridia bacterium]|nr:hypothetical protein [Clostridia bacterium]